MKVWCAKMLATDQSCSLTALSPEPASCPHLRLTQVKPKFSKACAPPPAPGVLGVPAPPPASRTPGCGAQGSRGPRRGWAAALPCTPWGLEGDSALLPLAPCPGSHSPSSQLWPHSATCLYWIYLNYLHTLLEPAAIGTGCWLSAFPMGS